jgi:hypothetical protein
MLEADPASVACTQDTLTEYQVHAAGERTNGM